MPRIAFLPDSFHEVNGVAHTARNFVDFARRKRVPMLCIRAGDGARSPAVTGTVEALELKRGPWAIRVEQDLSFDPLFFRYARCVGKALSMFKPDVVHITGPSELGILGAFFAWKLGIPLVASWHTNVHEYAGRRLAAKLHRFGFLSGRVGRAAEAGSLAATARFYRLARVLYAPNPALCALLQQKTGRPCHLMQRGVDAALFSPSKRDRSGTDPFTLGYVGRLSVEKNVRSLPQIHVELLKKGFSPHWLIVGHGGEEPLLRSALGPHATFLGVLRGKALAAAYANMDLLVFPSHTDTFGNVVLEALASGVPAIVTPHGGPAHIVKPGTGEIVPDYAFADAIASRMMDAEGTAAMRQQARAYALTCSWDAVFEQVLATYPSP